MAAIVLNELHFGSASLSRLSRINVILGKNGSGKSRFLREIDTNLWQHDEYSVHYISPERAGVFKKDGNIQNLIESNVLWYKETRRKNQSENFKAASAAHLREIELAYLRRLQDSKQLRFDLERSFKSDRLDRINSLFANIYLEQSGSDYVFRTHDGEIIASDQISSGESEAVTLAAEIMYFFETLNPNKINLLLLDEPDVHLHPDLQARMANFIINEVNSLSDVLQTKLIICVTTHSTPMVCALSRSIFTSVGIKNFDDSHVIQKDVSEQLKKVAPFFGHPLSLSLNNDPILIIEGEDDERVWQQASRSSKGRINLFPVLATSVDQQGELETFCAQFLESIYDSPIAFSLRDGDGKLEPLDPIGPVLRFRLCCYAIENALLSDESLSILNTTWPKFCEKATEWSQSNSGHKDLSLITQLIASPDRLRHSKIKAIRQLICSIAGSNKPWEVVVGQAIASLDISAINPSETGLVQLLGKNATATLLGPRE